MIAAVYHAPGDVRVEDMPQPRDPTGADVILEVTRAAICGTDASEFAHAPKFFPIAAPHPFSGHQGPDDHGPRVHRPRGRARSRRHGAGPRRPRRLRRRRVLRRVRMVPARAHQPVRSLLHARTAQPRRAHAVRRHARLALPGRAGDVLRRRRRHGATTRSGAARPAAQRRDARPVARRDRRRRHRLVPDRRRRRFGLQRARSLSTSTTRGSRTRATWAPRTRSTRSARMPSAGIRAATGEGADVVLEASGAPQSPAIAIASAKRGGTVLIVGLQAEPTALDLFAAATREVDIKTTLAHVCDEDLAAAVAMLDGDGVRPHRARRGHRALGDRSARARAAGRRLRERQARRGRARMKVAFIGLGRMGEPMAQNLAKAGPPAGGLEPLRRHAPAGAATLACASPRRPPRPQPVPTS